MSKYSERGRDYVTISHDGFARQSIIRRIDNCHTGVKCYTCGGLNRYGKVFEYGTHPDSFGARIHWHRGLFCSKECHDIYHS